MEDRLIEVLETKVKRLQDLQKEYEQNGQNLTSDAERAEYLRDVEKINQEKELSENDLRRAKKLKRDIDKRTRLAVMYNNREEQLLKEHNQKADKQHDLYRELEDPNISNEEKKEYKEMFNELSEDLQHIEERLEKNARKKAANKSRLKIAIKNLDNLEEKYGVKKEQEKQEDKNNEERNEQEDRKDEDNDKKQDEPTREMPTEDEKQTESDKENNSASQIPQEGKKDTERNFAVIADIADPKSDLFRSKIKDSFRSVSVEIPDESIDKLLNGETVNIGGKEYRIIESDETKGDLSKKTYIIAENDKLEKNAPAQPVVDEPNNTAPVQPVEPQQEETAPVQPTEQQPEETIPIQPIEPEQGNNDIDLDRELISPDDFRDMYGFGKTGDNTNAEKDPDKEIEELEENIEDDIELVSVNIDGSDILVNGTSIADIESSISEYTYKRLSEETEGYIEYDKNIALGLASNERQLDKYFKVCDEYTELQKYNDRDTKRLPEIVYDLKGLRKNKKIPFNKRVALYQAAKTTQKMYKEVGRKNDVKIKMSLIDKIYFGVMSFNRISLYEENFGALPDAYAYAKAEADAKTKKDVKQKQPEQKQKSQLDDLAQRAVRAMVKEHEGDDSAREQFLAELRNTTYEEKSNAKKDLDSSAQRIADEMDKANNEIDNGR